MCVCVLQLSGAVPSLLLLLLLALYSSLFPMTVGTFISRHQMYYVSCVMECDSDHNQCCKDCEAKNTCEPSREFCKKLCLTATKACITKCYEDTVAVFKKPPDDFLSWWSCSQWSCAQKGHGSDQRICQAKWYIIRSRLRCSSL
jgi:hypothetical protein